MNSYKIKGPFKLKHVWELREKYNCHISDNINIKAKEIIIGKNCIINEGTHIEVDGTFELGRCSHLGKNTRITCKSFKAGEYLYSLDGVEVGRGGCRGSNSDVVIGDHVMLCEEVLINPSEKVEIGDDVGIGAETQIWTHGAYLSVLDGFPSKFAPVKIGNNVWLPTKSTVLPGVTIGNNIVISAMTLVNKDLPDGCFAGGNPVKVIKENVYPKRIGSIHKGVMVNNILQDWVDELNYKGYGQLFKITDEYPKISLQFDEENYAHFDLNEMEVEYNFTQEWCRLIYEDCRDYLRRRGIKFFTGELFISLNKKDA